MPQIDHNRLLPRFQALIEEPNENGCRLWKGGENRPGKSYYFSLNGKVVSARLYVYETLIGPIPDKMYVLPTCGNRHCMSAEHLYLSKNKNPSQTKQGVDREEIVARFKSKVLPPNENGCEIWSGAVDSTGCGAFWVKPTNVGAHIFAWELYHGSVPSTGYIGQTCGDRRCCAKDHLEWTKVRWDYADPKSIEQRFLSFIPSTPTASGCLEWTGARVSDGYGVISVLGKQVRAHVMAYERRHGTKVPPGMQACHTCDNPPCVNPDHLFLGTLQENKDDCVAKERQAFGERNGRSVVTEAEAREIIKRLKGDESSADIARAFNVKPSLVYDIKHNRSWTHIER